MPAIAALFSMCFLGERPSRRVMLAIALSAAGVMAVAASPNAGAFGSGRVACTLLVLAAVACEAVFILVNKRLSRPVPALALSTLMSAGGLLMSVLPAWLAASSRPSVFSGTALLAMAYYAWVPTVMGFLIWYAGSACTTGARASLATAWLPASALLLAAGFLNEKIRLWQWLGLGCVLLGMALAATAPVRTMPE